MNVGQCEPDSQQNMAMLNWRVEKSNLATPTKYGSPLLPNITPMILETSLGKIESDKSTWNQKHRRNIKKTKSQHSPPFLTGNQWKHPQRDPLSAAGNICCTTELNSSWAGHSRSYPVDPFQGLLKKNGKITHQDPSGSHTHTCIIYIYIYVQCIYLYNVIYLYLVGCFYNNSRLRSAKKTCLHTSLKCRQPNAPGKIIIGSCGRSRKQETNTRREWNHHKNT